MADTNASLLMRVPFNVSNPATLDGLQLDMMYNDGFVA